MFSLQKNYIKEQEKLINHLQDQIIEKNLHLTRSLLELNIKNKLLPYFKKIAQLFAYYIPQDIKGVNIMIDILNQIDIGECSEDFINNIETEIKNWENTLIEEGDQRKEPTHTNESLYYTNEKQVEIPEKEIKEDIEILNEPVENIIEYIENDNGVAVENNIESVYDNESVESILDDIEEGGILEEALGKTKIDDIIEENKTDKDTGLIKDNKSIASDLIEEIIQEEKSIQSSEPHQKNDSSKTSGDTPPVNKDNKVNEKVIENYGSIILVESE